MKLRDYSKEDIENACLFFIENVKKINNHIMGLSSKKIEYINIHEEYINNFENVISLFKDDKKQYKEKGQYFKVYP